MPIASVDPGRRPRVVLVEDHPQVREKLADLLHDAGFEVVATVGDVASGYEAVCSTRPEIAVIDNRLPDGRGVDLCEWLGRMVPDTALIIHSAAITQPEADRALSSGVRAVVHKSLRSRELLIAAYHAADTPAALCLCPTNPVPTSTAASALGLQAHTLREWANRGGVHCATADEDGHRLWDLHDLRAQVVAYLEHGGSLQDIADESPP